MATNAQSLRPVPRVLYGFWLELDGLRIAVVARAEYVDRNGIEWGYCFSVKHPDGVFHAIAPGVTKLEPEVGEEAIRLIAEGKAVPGVLMAQLREVPEALWKATGSLRV